MVIVGQKITNEVRQTASFLRSKSMRITCVEFSFFQADGGTRLLSQEIVVGQELAKPMRVSSGSLPLVSEEEFIQALDENGRHLFKQLLQFANAHAMPIRWGTKGFSMNVDINGDHVAICYGYPPDSVYKQSIYTALVGRGGMLSKTAVSEEVVMSLWAAGESTGLFRPAGREQKCLIDHRFTDQEVSVLLSWFEKVATAIEQYGLKE